MIDLHVHSTASDGTLTPEELAAAGRDLAVMALTDHDTTDGLARFHAGCVREGVSGWRVAGVELDVAPGAGYGKFHLLGLGVDPASSELQDFLARAREKRVARNRALVLRFAELGMPFTMEELETYAGGPVVARPHVARLLVAHGWATSVADAFERWVGDGKPGYVAREHPSQEAAIAAVHAAGGLAVMAHPRYWTSDGERLRTGLAQLREMGLDGIEAVYGRNTPEETVLHVRLARELGLVMTAGSDFHGANKPDISLGMRIADEATFIAPFLERLGGRT